MHAVAAALNYVLIFCDDLGYNDLGCCWVDEEPHARIDAMSKEGCGSEFSRQSGVHAFAGDLLTGCYARRVGMHEDFTGTVLIPRSRRDACR